MHQVNQMSCNRFLLEHGGVCGISPSTHAHEHVNLASHAPLIPMMLHCWLLNRLLTALTSSEQALLFRSSVILHFRTGLAVGRPDALRAAWYFLKSLIQKPKENGRHKLFKITFVNGVLFSPQGQVFNCLKTCFVREICSGMAGKPTATYNTN